MNYIKLTQKKLQIDEINDLVAHETCGAISFFVGTTRDNFEDKEVISLEYEAYEDMATKTMEKICNEVRAQWNDVANIAVYHRLGIVPVKESSVIIAISSPHRQTSLDAVHYAINKLKECVPIWKKEKYRHPEGSSEWKENKEYNKLHKRKITENNSRIMPKFKRKTPVDFENCSITNDHNEDDGISNLIQITANDDEITRRVTCFVDRKREEIDLANIQDFIEKKTPEHEHKNEMETCARVNSVIFRMKNSKGHLRVNRVKNMVGPQEEIDYKNELDKLMGQHGTSLYNQIKREVPNEHDPNLKKFNGVQERIENVEKILEISPVSLDIYQRMKIIEDRLLYLEGVSPEYFNFVPKDKTCVTSTATVIEKRTYSVTDLDHLINQYLHSNV